MRALVVVCLGFILCSCEKDEFQDFELGGNIYESDYPEKQVVFFDGFSERGPGQSCELTLKFHTDLSGVIIHPDNIGSVLIFRNDNLRRRLPLTRKSTVFSRVCFQSAQYTLLVQDKEGITIGKPTVVSY